MSMLKLNEFSMNMRFFWTHLPNAVYILVFLCFSAAAVISALISSKKHPETTSALSVIFSILAGATAFMFTANKLPEVVDFIGFASVLTFFLPLMGIFAASEGVRGWMQDKRIKQEKMKEQEENQNKTSGTKM